MILLLTTPLEMCRWLKLCKRKHVRRYDNKRITCFAVLGFHAFEALLVT